MGCDIHLFLEYLPPAKQNPSKTWCSFGGEIYIGRNYDLFGTLAGVRSTEQPVRAPRGFPGDASFESVNYYYPNTDFSGEQLIHPGTHTPSWLTAKEFGAALKKAKYKGVKGLAVLELMKFFEKKKYKTRVVFWFDS